VKINCMWNCPIFQGTCCLIFTRLLSSFRGGPQPKTKSTSRVVFMNVIWFSRG
jgi:hypothetical protein